MVAGSLVEEQLSTLKEITVTIVVPRFEPIPGLTPDALQKMLRSRAVSIVTKYDLEVSESSHQDLVITVDATYQRAGGEQGILVLLVLSELREPGVLIRKRGKGSRRELFVASWREARIVLASSDNVIEKLVESVDIEVTEFAQKTIQARQNGITGRPGAQRERSVPSKDGLG
jgi:hypothetical protein